MGTAKKVLVIISTLVIATAPATASYVATTVQKDIVGSWCSSPYQEDGKDGTPLLAEGQRLWRWHPHHPSVVL